MPLSPAARHVLKDRPRLLNRLLTGGDDYELLFTASPGNARRVEALAKRTGIAIARIGRMEPGSGVRALNRDGRPITLKQGGYAHF